MEDVIDYASNSPNEALIYVLCTIITALCFVVRTLWTDRKAEEAKNFNMLLKSVENFKDNAVALEGLKDKVDQLLRKDA